MYRFARCESSWRLPGGEGSASDESHAERASASEAIPRGNTYDKYASTHPIEQRMMRGFMAALDGMLDGLAPQRILEIGVGEGQVMRRVHERFPGVPMAGLDLPDEALSDEWEALGLPCLFGDATALPFPDGGFDLVLAIEVLEHVPGPERGAGRAGSRLPRHARRLGPVRADLAGRQHGAPALRARTGATHRATSTTGPAGASAGSSPNAST